MSRNTKLAPAVCLLALLAGAGAPSEAGQPKARLRPRVRVPGMAGLYVQRAIEGAAERLAGQGCGSLLSDFASEADGRSLAAVLAAEGRTAEQRLAEVAFVDGSEKTICKTGQAFAGMLRSGDDVVYVCPARFRDLARNDPKTAQAIVLHELLHTLGLGENPPTSLEITARVLQRCGS